ncbi:MAG: iron ABC transporter permease [Candidatus Methanomethylophilaceae archaeon]|nr:iron ABC transporter permease [Candidatus Methanomethylophilaceae archaeon]TQS78342.1 MAG: iron ABC transporter permease [Candidatus Methanarcanum hacksteinii]
MANDDGIISLTDIIKNRIDEDTFEGKYSASVRKKLILILVLLFMSVSLMMLGMCLGSVDIPFVDLVRVFLHPIFPDFVQQPSETYYADFIYKGRMPRMFMILLTGFSLGMAGMVMQGLLRNPLVSPFTLGVSTAASFGAALSILFGSFLFGALAGTNATVGDITFYFDDLSAVLFAFVMAMLSMALILGLTKGKEVSRSTVILAGVVISYLFQAGIMATKYFSDDDQLREITLWIMGNFSGSSWSSIIILTPIVIICGIYLMNMALKINAMSAGDDVATSLGVDVIALRRNGLIVCTLVTASCLSFTGVIGFIGLMAPHICRMIIGNDSRYLLPASGLMGVVILLISDLFCRMIIRPGELPVGIVLYIVGGVFFVWMIANKKWSQRI